MICNQTFATENWFKKHIQEEHMICVSLHFLYEHISPLVTARENGLELFLKQKCIIHQLMSPSFSQDDGQIWNEVQT